MGQRKNDSPAAIKLQGSGFSAQFSP